MSPTLILLFLHVDAKQKDKKNKFVEMIADSSNSYFLLALLIALALSNSFNISQPPFIRSLPQTHLLSAGFINQFLMGIF